MSKLVLISARARSQAGIVTRAQLAKLGMKRHQINHLIRRGLLRPVHRSVYRVAGATDSPELSMWAAVLAAGKGALLSHASAAWLWKLDGFTKTPPARVELSVPASRVVKVGAGVRVHRVVMLDEKLDRFTVGGMPVTGMARTLIDLAAVVSSQKLEVAYDGAWRRHHALRDWLEAAVKRLGTAGRRGARHIVELIRAASLSATGSPLEALVRSALRREGIPEPMPQLVIDDADHEAIGRFDFAWPEYRVVLFVQSRQWHSSTSAFDKDTMQIAALWAAGWEVVPISHRRLEDRATYRKLRRALERGGLKPLLH
jgi:hypothetical protein